MPAINIARLKTQAARLSEKFGKPESFVYDLNEMLDFYTNRTIRATQIARRLSLPTYRTPAPVLRQIQAELLPLAGSRPVEAVALTYALWKAGSLESRLLAAYLLGSIPPAQAIPALTSLPRWLSQSMDKQIHQALFTEALKRVRKENPEAFFNIIQEWIGSTSQKEQTWGLSALVPLLRESQFDNLPAIFRIVRPAVLSASPDTQLALQTCLHAMETISPVETISFLREAINSSTSPVQPRVIGRMLPNFSPQMQAALRDILREKKG